MRIEAIHKITATDDDGSPIGMAPGDIKTVGENFGKLACTMGWARDVEGNVPTGEPSTRRVLVTPQNQIIESVTRS